MDKIVLKLNTLSYLGHFSNYKFEKFVDFDGYIYIINPNKLDVILSLLELLYEFNNYFNFFNNKNITSWLEEKGLVSYELLNEISYYKIKKNHNENITDIYSFINYSLGIYSYNPNCVNQYISYLLKETLKNIIIFDYIYNSEKSFNNYLAEVFNYYKSINMTPTKTFESLIYSILELDKIYLREELNYIDCIKIFCNINKNQDILKIKKFHNGEYEFFQECLNENLEITFKINTPCNYFFTEKLTKYLQISEFLTSKLLDEEFCLLRTLIPSKNANKKLIIDNITTNIQKANFSFINQEQILHFCLNEENKKLLRDIMPSIYNDNSLDKVYYFEKGINNEIKPVNYGAIILQQ